MDSCITLSICSPTLHIPLVMFPCHLFVTKLPLGAQESAWCNAGTRENICGCCTQRRKHQGSPEPSGQWDYQVEDHPRVSVPSLQSAHSAQALPQHSWADMRLCNTAGPEHHWPAHPEGSSNSWVYLMTGKLCSIPTSGIMHTSRVPTCPTAQHSLQIWW